MPSTQLTFTLEPRRVARLLTLAVTLLVAGSLAGQVAKLLFGVDFLLGFIPLTYVDREANLPSWFSSFTLLLVAATLWAIGSEARRGGRRGHSGGPGWRWSSSSSRWTRPPESTSWSAA